MCLARSQSSCIEIRPVLRVRCLHGVQAFRNVVRRMLEASGRGMWNASQDKLEDLQSMLNDIEDELEGVK